eukprot:655166-Pleurochrysis_carterae.AAC.1
MNAHVIRVRSFVGRHPAFARPRAARMGAALAVATYLMVASLTGYLLTAWLLKGDTLDDWQAALFAQV